MIKLMGNTLLRQILRQIHDSTPWYAIMADITNKEQPSISICWFADDYNIQEDFISLVHVLRITADVTTLAIKDILICLHHFFHKCRRQAYMMGS